MKPILFNTEMVRATLDGRKRETRRVIKGADPSWPLEWLGNDAAVTKVDRYGNEYPKPVPGLWATFEALDHAVEYPMFEAPYEPGDILYVRETWRIQSARRFDADVKIMFKAGGPMSFIHFPGSRSWATSRDEFDAFVTRWQQGDRWRPSIHMPKEAARLFLRVTDVWAERLQESFNAPTTPILAVQAEGIDIGDTCRDCLLTYGNPCCVDDRDDDSNLGECGMLDENRGEFSDLWDSTIKPADRDRYGWAANPWVWVICFERCEKPEEARHGK